MEGEHLICFLLNQTHTKRSCDWPIFFTTSQLPVSKFCLLHGLWSKINKQHLQNIKINFLLDDKNGSSPAVQALFYYTSIYDHTKVMDAHVLLAHALYMWVYTVHHTSCSKSCNFLYHYIFMSIVPSLVHCNFLLLFSHTGLLCISSNPWQYPNF